MVEEERNTRDEIIGEKIRAIRKAKGMSRRDLCDLLGGIYSYDALTRLELGKVKDLPVTVFAKISEVLNVPVEEFLSEDDRVFIDDELLKDPEVVLIMSHAKDLSPNDKKILLKILRMLKEEHKREREGKQDT
jgi:transcriptional regulator with XRE-family HTH domain